MLLYSVICFSHVTNGALYSLHVTSLQAGALPGAEVCPDLVLPCVFDLPQTLIPLIAYRYAETDYVCCVCLIAGKT